jgi:hypothetical protein
MRSTNELELKLEKATEALFERGQIAKWKIISPVERFLAKWADKWWSLRKLYVAYYRIFDRAYYEGGLNSIERTIAHFKPDISLKEKQELIVDMVYSLHRFGAMFTEYFLFDFPSLNTKGRQNFVTDKLRYSYCEIFNGHEALDLFDYKEKTYERYKEYYGRSVVYVSEECDLNEIIEFTSLQRDFILKPSKSSSGRGIEIVNSNEFASDQELHSYILAKSPCILEGVIKNHDLLSEIYDKALSTVRIPTIVTSKGPEIFASYIRFGKGGSVIDNVGSGGIVAVLDIHTGIVVTPAFDKEGNSYLTHPDSNKKIIGFQVPRWEEATKLAKQLSLVDTRNRYVGWDLAYTQKGWIMIEGNARGEFYAQQFPDRIGKKKWLDNLVLK